MATLVFSPLTLNMTFLFKKCSETSKISIFFVTAAYFDTAVHRWAHAVNRSRSLCLLNSDPHIMADSL